MSGMGRSTGKPLDGIAHLRESVADILGTPLGTRLMRRSYGSLIPELIDQPDNATTRVRVFAATASALKKWEPRLRLTRVQLHSGARPGQVVLDLEGLYIDPRRKASPLTLRSIPLQGRASA